MSLNLEGKQAVVAEVAEIARSAHAGIAADYRGMTVAEMTALRVQARDAGVYLRVVRNTLARRAFQETDFECMNEGLTGPLVLAFSNEDPGAAARVVRDFCKTNDKLKVKLIAFGGQLLEPSDLDRLAKMPTRDEALSQLLSVIMAPVNKLVRTLNEPHSSLARVLGAARDKRQAEDAQA